MKTELADLIRPGSGRGLDFVILEELQKRTGISTHEILKFAMSEMLCNSLDTDANEIYIDIKNVGEFDEIAVKDNGSKRIRTKDLKLILDFSRKASSKRGFLRVSRGYLGNALKCIFGYSYALAESRGLDPPEIVVESHGREYRINLDPDRIKDIINSGIKSNRTNADGFNKFVVKFPINCVWTRGQLSEDTDEPIIKRKILYEIILASSMVNPTRRIYYDLWGWKGTLGEAGDTTSLRPDTSVLWYELSQFKALFEDYVRARPETQLKEFIALFRGFKSKKIQKLVKEKLQELNNTGNHDSQGEDHVQFFPTAQIQGLSEEDMERLYLIMMERAKPISKRSVAKVLGVVGKSQFEKVKEQHDWKNLKYTLMKGRKKPDPYGIASFPFLIEIAVFDRTEDDGESLKVFQCVNFMASMEDIFSRLFNIKYRLGRVGISEDMPVTVLVHLISPVLKWLSYGKSGLYE